MKKIVIFGATGAMGSEIAETLKSEGYALHLVGRDKDRVKQLSSKLDANYSLGDVTEIDLFPRVADEAGEVLHGVVYAVGTLNLKGIKRFSEDEFVNDFRVNASGAALAIKHLLPALSKNEGISSVVLFSSVAAEQGFTFHASMGMAKGAVRGLTLALAAELAPKIRINAISPSLTDTKMAKGLLSNEKMAEAISKMHAMNRLGTPKDMAAICKFLLSEESSWVTGQIFGVDGGRSTLRVRS